MKGRMEPALITRQKLFQQVAAHLERQILEGRLKPGDLLPPERDLQARFGVGRPAVREALITLQRSGLVEISNGARSRVARPTASHIVAGMGAAVRQMLSDPEAQRQFQGVRFLFETALARNAARDASAGDLAGLRAALDANRRALGDREGFVATDVAFHFVLAGMTGNAVLAAMHDAMSGWLTGQRVATLAVPGQDRIAFEAHEAIHDAIVSRDPDRAEAAMAAHLTQLAGLLGPDPAGDG